MGQDTKGVRGEKGLKRGAAGNNEEEGSRAVSAMV